MAISYMQDGNDYTGGLTLNKMYQQPAQNPTTVTGLPASSSSVASTIGGQYKFGDISNKLGYDSLSPMYQALTGKSDNPFAIINQENGLQEYGNTSMAQMYNGFDPKIFDDYTFDWQDTGYGNSGNLTAFDKTGKNMGTWSQKDRSDLSILLEGGALAAAAFGGLGLAGQGPLSGLGDMFGGGNFDVFTSLDGVGGAAVEAGGAAGVDSGIAAALEAAGSGLTPEALAAWGGSAGVGTGEALALGGLGTGATGALNPALAESAAGLPGYGPSSANMGAASQSAGGLNSILNSVGMVAPNTASAIGKLGMNAVGGALGGGSGGGQSGGINTGNVLGSLLQMYQGNQYQDSIKQLYGQLASQFGPDSAYAKQLRQQLDRRDAAAGRRSQYGPREVELQAKLAENQSRQATTLAGLLKDSNAGLTSQLQGAIGLGNETGLNNWLGNAASGVGSGIWADVKNSDWWKDLFGGD